MSTPPIPSSPILFHAPKLSQDLWLTALRDALSPRSVVTWEAVEDPVAIDTLISAREVAEVLPHLPNLRTLVNLTAGIDYLVPLEIPESVAVHRLIDAGMGAQMAEYALHWAIHFQRDFDRYSATTRAGVWTRLTYRPPGDLHCGVLGLGVLGTQVAERLRDAGFSVSGWSRSPRIVSGVQCLSGAESLERFLSETEILVNLLPGTAETRGILNGARLDGLPKGAVVINLGRGSTLLLDDLLNRLDAGHLRAAVLDVTDPEPPPSGHPVWTHPRVFLTPHVSAQTQIGPAVAVVAEIIAAKERGEEGVGRVSDLTRGY
ncbi:2-hydroxyacid dehydrogenase [Rhodospirillum sp. A1_3_36]|uniref:2-hydroxyacid dehydrogenase n=1 Tax=Rhodospirillum sp. A1_3_36 TaxID=3391666 RepID=UPI0039A60AC2